MARGEFASGKEMLGLKNPNTKKIRGEIS